MTYEDYGRKAQKSLKAARVLFEIELYDSSASRSYYAMFQMASGGSDEIGNQASERRDL
jgi:uncharacterized protein (UPF0332 family)